MPTVKELQTLLLPLATGAVAIAPVAFADTVAGNYWTSSAARCAASAPERAWLVQFHDGGTVGGTVSDPFWTRCVRDLP